MKRICLILFFATSTFAAHGVVNQSYGQSSYGLNRSGQTYGQNFQSYGLNRPYGQNYGQNFQSYGLNQPYGNYNPPYGNYNYNYNPYGAYPYTPYEPDNGPMRGPNSIEGHMQSQSQTQY